MYNGYENLSQLKAILYILFIILTKAFKLKPVLKGGFKYLSAHCHPWVLTVIATIGKKPIVAII